MPASQFIGHCQVAHKGDRIITSRFGRSITAEQPLSVCVVGQGDEILVFLRSAFERQEVIVTAAAAGITTAYRGSGLIDGAAPLFGIEELANPAEVLIGLPPHRILLTIAGGGILLLRLRKADTEMLCQPLHIPLLQRD